jgi:hypothetical protein
VLGELYGYFITMFYVWLFTKAITLIYKILFKFYKTHWQ